MPLSENFKNLMQSKDVVKHEDIVQELNTTGLDKNRNRHNDYKSDVDQLKELIFNKGDQLLADKVYNNFKETFVEVFHHDTNIAKESFDNIPEDLKRIAVLPATELEEKVTTLIQKVLSPAGRIPIESIHIDIPNNLEINKLEALSEFLTKNNRQNLLTHMRDTIRGDFGSLNSKTKDEQEGALDRGFSKGIVSLSHQIKPRTLSADSSDKTDNESITTRSLSNSIESLNASSYEDRRKPPKYDPNFNPNSFISLSGSGKTDGGLSLTPRTFNKSANSSKSK